MPSLLHFMTQQQLSLLPDLPDKEVHDFSHTQAHREFELILGELDVVWARVVCHAHARGVYMA